MATNVNNVKNEDLDELTAMLQSLDETVASAVKANGTDEIDDLLLDLTDDVTKPVEAVADEVMKMSATDDLIRVFEELEVEHQSVKVIEPEPEPEPEEEATTPAEETSEERHEEIEAVNSTSSPVIEKDARKSVSRKIKSETAKAKPRFTLEGKGDDFYESAGLKRDEFTATYQKSPVKAKDKIVNLLNWYSGGPEISVYTVLALRHLLETKTATSNSIKLALMSNPEKPYPLSTASTQAGQMMAVFPATGIATREGGCLTLNAESPIVKKFVSEYSIG